MGSIPDAKKRNHRAAEQKFLLKIQEQFQSGLVTLAERYNKVYR